MRSDADLIAMFVTAFLPLFLGFAFCSEDAEWCYRGENGPSEWYREFPNCSERYNKRQSPIDLPAITNADRYIAPFLEFRGYEKTLNNATIINTGKTIEIIPNPGDAYIIADRSYSSPYPTYRLENIHFHWGSEHTVQGKRYALEAHFVHRNEKYATMEEALNRNDGIVVLATFYSPCFPGPNLAVSKVVDSLKDIKYANTRINFSLGIPLSSFLPPSDYRCFYVYDGSLTTPGCNPVVSWHIYSYVQGMTYDMMDKLYGVYESEECEMKEVPLINNYRPVQLRNGRLVWAFTDCRR